MLEFNIFGACNRSCSFCPVSDTSFYKNVYQGIDLELYQKILIELKEVSYSGTILFSAFSEPLLNKNIFLMIEMTKKYLQSSSIEIVSNGDVIIKKSKVLKKLFDSGLDVLSVSIYDGQEEFDYFEKLVKKFNIKNGKIILRRRYLLDDNYGIGGNINLSPEKSRTNELYAEYNFSEKLKLSSTAYRATIFDRIESNSSYFKHENKLIDLNQEGLESEVLFNGANQSFSIFTNFAKSRKTNGQAQSRRPDLSYGINFSKKIGNDIYSPFNLNINYKYTGQYVDWDGSQNSKQKSTDLLDMSVSKDWFGNTISFNITNLLNERYEKPATYSQDGRQFRIGFRKSY